ncbi:hypothetical protein P4594_26500 [Priestia megaterium]|uniref:hypothetical protein n=1 Tax=Priestia megaterium TaxID=1404 RepID=UPI002E203619|nr:hypothetical protein [Priestia megaterium]
MEPPLQSMARNIDESRQGRAFIFDTIAHGGFERRLNLSGIVNSSSKVFVSISEIGIINGQVKPFMGSASMEVHNVVPQDDGIVIVRGNVDWNNDLNVRLSVLVM